MTRTLHKTGTSHKKSRPEDLPAATGYPYGDYDWRELLRQLRHGIPREQLARLAEQTPINTSVTLSLIALILGFVLSQVSMPMLVAWGGVHTALIFIPFWRWWHSWARAHPRTGVDMRLTRSGLYHAMVWAAVSGLLWGALTLFLPGAPPHIQFLLIISIGGMTAGASATLAAVPQVATVFMIGASGPLIAYFAMQHDSASNLMAITFAIFTAAMIGTTQVVYATLLRQLKAETQAQQLGETQLQQRAATIANSAENTEDAIRSILKEMCSFTGWSAGHLYYVADDGSGDLVPSEIWVSDDHKRFAKTRAATHGTRFKIGSGFPGRVAAQGKPLWLPDDANAFHFPTRNQAALVTEELKLEFPRIEAVAEANIRGMLGLPVTAGANLMAVLELFSETHERPSTQLIGVLQSVATQLGRSMERERSGESLKESETKFRTLIESSTQGILVHDFTGNIQYINEQGAKMLGYTVEKYEEIPSVFEFVHPDDRERMRGYRDARVAGQPVPESYEFQALHRDGHTMSLLCRGNVIDWQGKKALLMTAVDLTRRKLMEDALRVSETKFRTLIEQSAQAIAVYDGDDALFVNEQGAKMFGYSVEEFMALDSIYEIVHADDRKKMKIATDRRNAEHLGPTTFEFKGQHQSGREMSLVAKASLTEWDGRDAILVTVIDITEQKQAMKTSLREEARARDYLDIAGSIICAIGVDENVSLINHAGCRILECDESEANGHNWFDNFVPEEQREARREQFARWMRGEEELVLESKSRVITLKGNERFVQWQVAPLTDDGGNLIGILRSGQDLTDQMRAEEQLQQAQKMEAVGQLTSGIAHDFNNILAVVMGNLELAGDWLKEGKDVERLIALAMDGAQKGADLNRQLLTFSRRQVFENKICDVNQVIDDMTGLLQRSLGETVRIDTKLCNIDCHSALDPAQLESAILNLALNARDAMPDGGSLTIETSVMDSEEYPGFEKAEAPLVHILVSDTGTGMPPEVRERALEPFFTTKEAGLGSGLGLSMVYGFVDQTGGQMDIDSTPGKGTDIHLFLRRAWPSEPASEKAVTPETVTNSADGQTVLVVEDQKDVCDIICSYLERLGYNWLAAHDGPAACTIIAETGSSIDIVLSDMVMPGGIDGIEVLTTARERIPGVKTVLMSGNPALSEHYQKPEMGDAQLLRKPFRRDDLAAVLRRGQAD